MFFNHSVKIQTVSELTGSIRGLLETEFPFVSVSGEVTNLRKPYSGHLYFTLKDSKSQIKAVLFKQQQRYLKLLPNNGISVICRGRISLYEPRGEYQIVVDTIEELGAGRLQAAFELLKRTLTAEGLFEQDRKSPLPFLPGRVSLITSPRGAAVHDFIKTARQLNEGLPIEIYPVSVQGDSAPAQIIAAIEELNEENNSDVIVLCRGGGSMEDLQAFNDEGLARAIAGSAVPIVTAIGHEVDFTIADFAADARAATPTAAAKLVVPDHTLLVKRIELSRRRIIRRFADKITRGRLRLKDQKKILGDPSLLISNFRLGLDNRASELSGAFLEQARKRHERLDELSGRLHRHDPGNQINLKRQKTLTLRKNLESLIRRVLDRQQESLRGRAALLEAVSPLAVLARGYSIVSQKGEGGIVRDSRQLREGDQVDIVLHRGRASARVTGTAD